MQISKNTWHYKVYDWHFQKTCGRTLEDYQRSWGHTVSLCPYVRTILLWAPLRWIFTPPRLWYLLSGASLAMVWDDYRVHGVPGMVALGVALFALAIVVGTLWLVVTLSGKLGTFLRKRSKTTVTVNFSTVLHERLKAAHEGICPFITFVGEEGPEPDCSNARRKMRNFLEQ